MNNDKKTRKVRLVGFVFLVALLGMIPSAYAIDVTGATGLINTDGKNAVTDIGQVMLELAGLAVVFKWAKASIFG